MTPPHSLMGRAEERRGATPVVAEGSRIVTVKGQPHHSQHSKLRIGAVTPQPTQEA